MSKWETRFNQASRFWMGDMFDTYQPVVQTNYTSYTAGAEKAARLVQVHKACANFVKILTGTNIPVNFSTKGQSFTDGKTVTISADVNDTNFDVTVGLCLHEAAHCILSNFQVLKSLKDQGADYNLKDILNWVEDRRIDRYVYDNAPGYQGYYDALYDKYFHNPIIDKALKSSHFRDETYESYIFRVSNIMNSNSDLNALKGLSAISNVIDLPNINRLKNTQEALRVAKDVLAIINRYVNMAQQQQPNMPPPPDGPTKSDPNNSTGNPSDSQKGDNKPSDSKPDKKDDNKNDSNSGQGDGESNPDAKDDSDSNGSGKGGDKSDNQSGKGDKGEDTDTSDESDSSSESEGSDSGTGTNTTPGKVNESSANTSEPKPLSAAELQRLVRAIASQDEFLKGESVKKKAIDDNLQKAVKDLNSLNADIEMVPTGTSNHIVPCMRYDLNDKLFEPYGDPHGLMQSGTRESKYAESVNDGLALGAQLGSKLKLHDENRELVNSHRAHGKIDKRLIASLGMGVERVFYNKQVDKHTPKQIYVTLDASGSMGASNYGDEQYKNSRFYKAQTAVVALIKACSMVQSIRIIVDYRYASNGNAVALRVYDSKYNKIHQVNLIKRLAPTGGTPEGYAMVVPIKKDVPKGSANLKSYFINFSDGEPSFNNGIEYTQKLIKELKQKDVTVMSYFIQEGDRSLSSSFVKMYGKESSKNIDTTKLTPLAKSLNEMFLAS